MSEKNFVSIVGAGPAGLMMACELGSRNVPCILIDKKIKRSDPPVSKAVFTHSRSLEHFRRFQLMEKIDQKAISADYPTAILFCTGLRGDVTFQVPFTSRINAKPTGLIKDMSLAACPGKSPELPRWIYQLYLEEILFEKASGYPSVEVRAGHLLNSAKQNGECVQLDLTDLQTQNEYTLNSSYVVGCDGAASTVRKGTDIKLVQCGPSTKMYEILFTSSDLMNKIPFPRAILYNIKNPKIAALGVIATILVQMDDRNHLWSLQSFCMPEFDLSKIHPEDLFHAIIDCDFEYTVHSTLTWNSNVLHADHFSDGRIFLAGDSSHQFPHTGGLGMNSGVGDACNLAWKLAAIYHGWGGQGLLESYEIERKQVIINNMNASKINRERIKSVDFSPKLSRFKLIRSLQKKLVAWKLRNTMKTHFVTEGLQLGYHCEESPICISDGKESTKPPSSINNYIPVTRAGHRLPHSVLSDGSALYDHLGKDFTLIKLDATINTENFERVAKEKDIPLEIFTLPNFNKPDLYEAKLILVRPDQEVAWIADDVPADLNIFWNRVTGRL